MERLPFADGVFARALMVDTFHHLRDQQQTATELLRVLSPQGRLVLEEQNVERVSIRLTALAEKVALMRSHFHPPQVVQQMFEAAGGRVRLERDGINFWAVVEKRDGGSSA
jgi:ubiquinone/menaquinone biosynthesis C-methylase UbiE